MPIKKKSSLTLFFRNSSFFPYTDKEENFHNNIFLKNISFLLKLITRKNILRLIRRKSFVIIFFHNKSFFPMPRKYQCPIRHLEIKEKPRQTKVKTRRAFRVMREPIPNKVNKANTQQVLSFSKLSQDRSIFLIRIKSNPI